MNHCEDAPTRIVDIDPNTGQIRREPRPDSPARKDATVLMKNPTCARDRAKDTAEFLPARGIRATDDATLFWSPANPRRLRLLPLPTGRRAKLIGWSLAATVACITATVAAGYLTAAPSPPGASTDTTDEALLAETRSTAPRSPAARPENDAGTPSAVPHSQPALTRRAIDALIEGRLDQARENLDAIQRGRRDDPAVSLALQILRQIPSERKP
jgi:hypothetical protein